MISLSDLPAPTKKLQDTGLECRSGGGIYPNELLRFLVSENMPCAICQGGDTDCFIIEFTEPIHSRCVQAFCETAEGQLMIRHGHSVVIVGEYGEHVVLHNGNALY